MRNLAAILVALALPASMLAAPFSHVHDPGVADEDVAEHHAGGLELHFHLAGIDIGARTWTWEVNESAQSLNLYKANRVDPFVFTVAIVIEQYVPSVAASMYGWTRDCDVRIHDPPRIQSRSPRAPPA